MLCPNCGSMNVAVAEKRNKFRSYRVYRGVTAKLLAFFESIMHMAFREVDGQECVCMHCGHRWYPQREMLEQQYKKCLASLLNAEARFSVKTVDGFDLCMDSYGITVYRENKYKFGIPYSQITAVRYQENIGPLYGWLSIRYIQNQKRPFPASYAEAQKDKTTFLFGFSYSSTYLKIYTALYAIVNENIKAGLF